MNTWEKINTWFLVLPPSRPTILEIDRIRLALRGIDRALPVAVLGSTPEFRQVLADFSEVTIFHNSDVFHRQATALCPVRSLDERQIVGDWLETLPNHNGRFALVLSDLTIGNIRYNQREEFYCRVHAALHKHGIFIDKILSHPIPHISLKEIDKKYSNSAITLQTVNHFNCEAIFCSELLLHSETVDTDYIYSALGERYVHQPHLAEIASLCQNITPRKCVWYYGKYWEEVAKTYCRNFSSAIYFPEVAPSPYAGRSFQYIHTK